MSAYGFYGQAATPAMTATVPADSFGGAMGGANGPRRDHVTRILVVGETRVGKTLLIRRLCDHIFGDTAIETSAVDYSPFNSNAAAERAADDDDLGPEWGPTVGLAVDALKRSTTVLSAVPPSNDLRMPPLYAPASQPSATASAAGGLSSSVPADNSSYGGYPSLYGAPTLLNGGGSVGGGLQYRGANPTGNANPFNGPLGGSHPTHPAPLQHRCTVTQTVEFHELGGTHGYRDIARLPLRSLHYDGVIFVYHRRNPTSTLYLADWYHWVRGVLSTSASVSGPGNPHNGTSGVAGCRTMPRFMLVGTQLEGDEVTAAAAGMRKVVDGTLHIGAMAVSDEALLDGNIELKVRALQSPQTPTRRSRTRAVCRSVLHSLTLPYHLLWCLWHPFFFLSEQYQEERGPRSKVVTLGARLVERLLWLLYRCEQGLLYVMAVVLFGPYQEAVVLGHASAKQTLEELRKDEQCVAQAHVCRLDSDIALQSSLDEMVAFFDILLRQE